jgi:serine protease AprX
MGNLNHEGSVKAVKLTVKWRFVAKVTSILLVIMFTLSSIALPALAEKPKPLKIHPVLDKTAKNNPDSLVRIIVKGKNLKGELDAKVAGKGARGKKDLPVSKAIAAEMKAKDAKSLSEDSDVEWVTVDAPMVPAVEVSDSAVDISGLAEDYALAVNADDVWNSPDSVTGEGVTVAVIDSGIHKDSKDFQALTGANKKVIESVRFNEHGARGNDHYGHGTHVAGIIASSGKDSHGKYIGIAPDANLIDVKVSDEEGMAYTSDVIDALQWVILNKGKFNIRVINLSLVSSVAEPYQLSPLDAAVETVWLSGVAVVTSSGNLGADSMYFAPANDPFVITVGAVDTNGTPDIADDSIPSWSSFGVTQNGYNKPEVVAPGRQIISDLASVGCILAKQFKDRVVDKDYIMLSGTSMATPMVSGVAALALQAHPDWTPDQLKAALISTARPISSAGGGAGEVDAAAVVNCTLPGYANQGVPLNFGVANAAGTTIYDAATWNAATWNAATWNAATWNSTVWDAATWNAATWNAATWNAATWNNTTWSAATWNSIVDD